MAPLLRDEDLDLTINELMRIRERPFQTRKDQGFKGSKVQGLKGEGVKGPKRKGKRKKSK
ncbi:MAG: hypothetical protein A2W66_12780 [Deltaproteobacteria bacterium RIFCSPLOWO2_02_56_12]|nr:MAG: hypothetical protein A2W66_12780 [Deltaproteobacteria bacterium RIFCSPLOWO2_02_56_12]